MVLIDGFSLFSSLICKSYEQWKVVDSALALLKISVNLWYSGGTMNGSTRLLVILAGFSVRSMEQSARQNIVDPIIHVAQIYD